MVISNLFITFTKNLKLITMEAKIKINPVRIRVPKYGNGLMLLMEYAGRYTTPILGKVTELDDNFDIELRMTRVTAQSVKKYINLNL